MQPSTTLQKVEVQWKQQLKAATTGSEVLIQVLLTFT